MTNKPIYTILSSPAHIADFLNDMTIDAYNADLIVRRAVEREFEILGEILKRLRDNFPELHAKIPDAPQIIGFRNVIAHGYDVVSDDRVYRIATEDVPRLREVLVSIQSA